MAFIVASCSRVYRTIHRSIIRSFIALDPRPQITKSKKARFIRTLYCEEGPGECPICFSNYLDMEVSGSYRLPCGHRFCGVCTGAIVARFNECSLCRSLLIPRPIYERKAYLIFTAVIGMTHAMALAMIASTYLAGVYWLSSMDDPKMDMLGNGFIFLGLCMQMVAGWMRRRREGIQGWRVLALENGGGKHSVVLDILMLLLQLLFILIWLVMCGGVLTFF